MRPFNVAVVLALAHAGVARWVPRQPSSDLVTRQEPEGPVEDDTHKLCTYFVTVTSKLENCQWLSDYWGISYEDFVAWNPSVKEDCSGIKIGNSYCVEVNRGEPIPSPTAPGDGGSGPSPSPTAVPTPSPVREGTVANCNKFHFAVAGDLCGAIADQYGISFDQFYQWNPTVGAQCNGLWALYYYCVSVPGTTPVTTTAAPVPDPSPTGPVAPGPTQGGIVANCRDWYGPVKGGDTCDGIASTYGLTFDQFRQWNPAVGQTCQSLWAQYYYCVGTADKPAPNNPPKPTTTPPTPLPTGCSNANPSPTQPGSICQCKRWHQVQSGNSCWDIFQRYGITQEQFDRWNPGNNCNIWLGYNVCVGA